MHGYVDDFSTIECFVLIKNVLTKNITPAYHGTLCGLDGDTL